MAAQINVERSILLPEETFATNAVGTFAILCFCTKFSIPLIMASSAEIYGNAVSDKIDETHPIVPKSPHAASKASADAFCVAYHRTYGTKVIIVRNFNTFGFYQRDDVYGAVISIFVRQRLEGNDLTVFGDGLQERDYMFCTDAIDLYDLLVDRISCNRADDLWGESFNVGTGRSVRIIDIARKVAGSLKVVHLPPRPGEVRRLVCDNTKCRKLLGWLPKVSFEEGLELFFKWKESEFVKVAD